MGVPVYNPGATARIVGSLSSPAPGLGGRAVASASGSPPNGEMWSFTFTLQCRHLNHCLHARTQGCSPASRGQSSHHHPRRPKGPSQPHAAHRALSLPSLQFPSFAPRPHLWNRRPRSSERGSGIPLRAASTRPFQSWGLCQAMRTCF